MFLWSRFVVVIGVSSLLLPVVSFADSASVVGELKNCARIAERDSRVDCYEALGGRVLEGEASTQSAEPVAEPATTGVVATAAVTTAGTPSEVKKMDDHMGGYQFEEKASDHPDNDIQTRVTLCQQDRDKVWHFKFENGQVWKQVDRTRLNFQGCDFPVTLAKDGFGYKMQIEGSERQIRISRQK